MPACRKSAFPPPGSAAQSKCRAPAPRASETPAPAHAFERIGELAQLPVRLILDRIVAEHQTHIVRQIFKMPRYCSLACSGSLNKSTSSTRTSVRSAIMGIASTASRSACGEMLAPSKRWALNSAAGPHASFLSAPRDSSPAGTPPRRRRYRNSRVLFLRSCLNCRRVSSVCPVCFLPSVSSPDDDGSHFIRPVNCRARVLNACKRLRRRVPVGIVRTDGKNHGPRTGLRQKRVAGRGCSAVMPGDQKLDTPQFVLG